MKPVIPRREQVPADFRLPYHDESHRGLVLRRFYFEGGLRDPARAVVCIPGLAASGRSFARLAPLASRFDLRLVTGPLAAPYPGDPIGTLAGVVADSLAGLRKPVLLGTSFGSLVALRLALELGQELSGLVLVSGLAGGSMVPRRYAAFAGALLAPRPFAWLASPLAARVLGGRGLDREARREIVREGRLVSGAELFRRTAAVLGMELAPLLRRVEVPFLAIHGTRDRVIPPRAARTLAAEVPGARFLAIEGAGHMPYLSHPRRFMEALAPFLDEVLPPPAASLA